MNSRAVAASRLDSAHAYLYRVGSARIGHRNLSIDHGSAARRNGTMCLATL